MLLRKTLLLLPLLGSSLLASAQLMQTKETFTRADSLRGGQPAERTCYDLNYYHLDVKLDVARKFISGSNLFRFNSTSLPTWRWKKCSTKARRCPSPARPTPCS
jgi:hypothetical protein